jgi:hypothetical protein
MMGISLLLVKLMIEMIPSGEIPFFEVSLAHIVVGKSV